MYFDIRVHPAALCNQDLETMRSFGVSHAVLVADGTIPPAMPRAIIAAFEQLLFVDRPRFAAAGITTWVALGVHPAALPRRGLNEVLALLPQLIAQGGVAALGLVGLTHGTPHEVDALLQQLDIARRFKLPVMTTVPAQNQVKTTKQLLSHLRQSDFPAQRVLVDGQTSRTLKITIELGFWAAVTLHPDYLARAAAERLIRKCDVSRVIIDSAAGFGASDILAVPHCAHRLGKSGLSDRSIHLLTYENAARFLRLALK